MNTERVKIKLGEKECASPPVKYIKARNGSPVNTNFLFRPKAFPHLNDHVRVVEWDAAKKTVYLLIAETAKFEVYNWIIYTNKQNHEIEKSPFVDVDTNSATLTFSDHNCVPVASIKFRLLTLDKHNCVLGREDSSVYGIDAPCEGLVHEVTFVYKESELVVHADELPPEHFGLSLDDEQGLKDAEWQTVEIPA